MSHAPEHQATPETAHRRIPFFDALRGLTICSMVAFHASYDLAYLYGISMPWFTVGPFQEIWRSSISWTFLALAGWMTIYSRNNFKRAGVYGLSALTVYIATTVAAVDTPVNFGILFCMAASTLIFALAEPVLKRVPPLPAFIVLLALFALTWQVPHRAYEVWGLSWLGFPSPTFASGDYYPLVPFTFMYLAGSYAANLFKRHFGTGAPAWMYACRVSPLEAIGRHSLLIYLAHQPLILLALNIAFGS